MADDTNTSSGNVWKRKIGPLPMWGWAGIVFAAGIVIYLYRKNQAAAASSSSSTGAGSSSGSTSVNSPGGVDASLVPQFVNQTYVQSTPPAAPAASTPSTTTTPPPTTTTTPAATASVSQYPAPSGLKVSNITRTAITASWSNLTSPTPVPTSYTVAVYDKAGSVVSQQTVNAPDTVGGSSTTTITGLPNGKGPFQIHVWANGGKLAPPHASATFSLV